MKALSTFFDLFTPKLFTVLKEGYGFKHFRADFMSGLTVAIVALPLSMAIGIASGVGPDKGILTSIVGGFLVSFLSGCRLQIGGPEGAFIVLVSTTLQQHGLEGLILATFLSGFMTLAAGLLRLGTFIKYIPYPVTIAFTAGIATIVLTNQVKELLGLTLPTNPAPLIEKIQVLGQSLGTLHPQTLSLSLLTLGTLFLIRKYRPHWPAFLIAVILSTLITQGLDLDLATIGSRFGGIPQSLPSPTWPTFSLEKILQVLPNALSFTLLGSIESLLCAVVADSMSGYRHRSNMELVGQGIANIGSALFGGFCVTGTTARTATNIRAGAHSPISGMLHAIFLLLFILLAAPLASYIPLAALASVLTVISWNMVEKTAFWALLRTSKGDAAIVLTTFLLVAFHDLSSGILIGFAMGTLLFMHRMAQAIEIKKEFPPAAIEEDKGDREEKASAYTHRQVTDSQVVVYRLSGAFFFGAASFVDQALDSIGEQPKAYVLDFSKLHMLDSTAASTLKGFIRKAKRRSALIYIAGADEAIRHTLQMHGVKAPGAHFCPSVKESIQLAHDKLS